MTASGLVAAGAVLLVAGMALGNPALALAGLGPLVVVGLGVALALPDVTVRRTVAPSRVQVDDPFTVTRDVSMGRGLAIVMLADVLPPELALVEGNNVRLLWKGFAPRTFQLSYRARAGKRGAYLLSATHWHVQHPLGLLAAREGTAGDDLEMHVAPRLLQMHRLRPPRSRAATLRPDMDAARIGQPTTDFQEIREYAPGDPLRLINWKATARLSADGGAPLVNQYELEGQKSVWLFIDGTAGMEVGTNLDSALERGIEAASGLASYFLRRGYRLGASFYGTADKALRFDSGKRQWVLLARRLVTLRSSPGGPDLSAAVDDVRPFLRLHRPLAVVVTRLDQVPATGLVEGVRRLAAITASHRSRGRVLVVGMTAAALVPATDGRQALAMRLLAAPTRGTARALRRLGVSVVQWDPTECSLVTALMRQTRLPV